MVTYGNRSFDNSLAELCAILEENDFNLVGAGAFVAQHAFLRYWPQAVPMRMTWLTSGAWPAASSKAFKGKTVRLIPWPLTATRKHLTIFLKGKTGSRRNS